MLTSLSLTNFKAWKSIQGMRLAPITGLFGTNSSGKSSILQFLLMLKQTADSPDRGQVLYLGEEKSDKSLALLGTFDDLLHKAAGERRVSWRLSWKLPKGITVSDPEDARAKPLLRGDEVEFTCEISEANGGRLAVDEMAYGFAGHRFVMRPLPGNRKETGGKYSLSAEGAPFEFRKSRGRPPEGLSPPVKCYGFPDEVRAAFQNAGFLSDLELEFERQMQGMFYLGPLREYPFRDYR